MKNSTVLLLGFAIFALVVLQQSDARHTMRTDDVPEDRPTRVEPEEPRHRRHAMLHQVNYMKTEHVPDEPQVEDVPEKLRMRRFAIMPMPPDWPEDMPMPGGR